MSEESSEVPNEYVALEERVLAMLAETPQWDFKVVRAFFPNEHEKALYRAIKKLEESGRIVNLGWQGRTKKYTTMGISKLPTLVMPNGQRYDIKTLFATVPTTYENGISSGAKGINEILITINQLFLVAQLSDDKELLAQYKELILKFSEYKRILTTMLAWVEAVQQHPIMSGDLKTFKSILTGDSPDQEQINQFRVWVSRFRRGEFN